MANLKHSFMSPLWSPPYQYIFIFSFSKNVLIIFLKIYIYYCILGSGVHVKNMQVCCIGTYMAMWFAAFIPITYIWHFSLCYPSPTPYALLSLCLSPPQQTLVCDAPLPVSMCSCCSTPISENVWCVMFDFLFLCQFAENDGFQVHPCPYKGHELIVFYGCIVFHGVYVPHLPIF